MSDRERWIIYPLLFFSLTLAASGKIYPRFRRVICNELTVVSSDGKQRVRIDASSGSHAGRILLFGADDTPVISLGEDQKTHVGVIQTWNRQGTPMVVLSATDGGGVVQAVRADSAWRLLLGHGGGENSLAGLLAIDSKGRVIRWGMPVPWSKKTEPEKE